MRTVITGGGTGGHIYPALAIARGILQRVPDAKILYVGTRQGLENDLIPRAHIPFRSIHARGLLVPGWRGKVRGAISAFLGLAQALAILRTFRPEVVVGTGGYVSGPVGLAAYLLRIPLVLQEQNVWPGFTNRLLGPKARAVLVPYEEARRYFPKGTPLVVVGNPVRVEVTETKETIRRELGIAPDAVYLMVTGGSQGALAINRFMLHFLPEISDKREYGIFWATGKRYYQSIRDEIRRMGLSLNPDQVKIFEYFYDIQKVYRAADVFFGRAGAMTLADCQAFGLPMILVPSPNVSEDHQTKNAQIIEERGAGLLVSEDRLDEDGVKVLFSVMGDRRKREGMSQASYRLFDANTENKIFETIDRACRSRR